MRSLSFSFSFAFIAFACSCGASKSPTPQGPLERDGRNVLSTNAKHAAIGEMHALAVQPPQDGESRPPPSVTTWTLHIIDVGTGLSIFVREPDFTLLYDAGSSYDTVQGEGNRVRIHAQHTLSEARRNRGET